MLQSDSIERSDDAPMPCELCGDYGDTYMACVYDGYYRRQCWNGEECQRRQAERDADTDEKWLAQRFTITPAGRQYLEERDPIVSLTDTPGVFVTDSQTVAGVTYTLTAPDGVPACTCPGFEHWHRCKHARQLERIFAGHAVLQWREQGEQLPLAVA